MRNRNLLLVVSGSVVGIAVLWLLWASLPESDVKEMGRTIRCAAPILLIHGLGGSAETWSESGYVEYLEQLGLRYGGVVRATGDGGARIEGGRVAPEDGEVFVFEVSDSWASLDVWQEEIRAAVEEVTARTGLPKVVMVGYSAGGVAAREYVVEHPEDHRVVRLVTASSPNAGSELAVAAELQRTASRLPVADVGTAILDRWEAEHGLRVDSPLLRELLPPESGNYLDRLNRSPHPKDVEYACVIATGTEVAGDWRKLQNAMVRTREGKTGASLLEFLSTGVMRLLAWGTGNLSPTGDGAVLVASQHLGRVEFFRHHPDLVKKVLMVAGSHEQMKHRYRALTEALGDSVAFLRAQSIHGKTGDMVSVDFRSPLAGLSKVSADLGQGHTIDVDRPVLYRRGDEVFARVSIGPVPADAEEVRLRVQPPDAPLASGAILRPGKASELPPTPAPRPFELRLLGVLGTDAQAGVGAGGVDLQAVVFLDDAEVFRTPVEKDVPDVALLRDRGRVTFDPRFSRLELDLRDVDGMGLVPKAMGKVVWKPGQIMAGQSLLATDTGIGIDVDLVPLDGDPTGWYSKPLYWGGGAVARRSESSGDRSSRSQSSP